jgi:hypothetical protein
MLAQLASQAKGVAVQAKTLANDVGVSNEQISFLGAVAVTAAQKAIPLSGALEGLIQRGRELRINAEEAAAGVESIGNSATEVAPALDGASGSTERFSTSLQDIGTDSGQAFTDINNGATTFKSLIDEGNISLADTNGLIGAQLQPTTERMELVGKINTYLGEGNTLTQEQLDKLIQQIGAEEKRNEKIAERQEKSAADYNLQIQINEALAAGNTTLAEGLEYQREHSQLTEKIMRETGMSKEEASQLATNFLASKDAADEASESARKLGGDTAGAAGEAGKADEKFKSVRDTMADIENAKLEAAPQRLKERTNDARKELKSMADFIGQDISNLSLDNILTKLGLDPNNFKTTDEKLTALEGSLEKLGSADPAEITPEVDLVGVNDRLEKVKEYLSGTEKKKPDVTPQVDQGKLKAAVDSAKTAIEKGLSKNKIELNLNAEKAIGKIRKDLKEQIDLAIGSSEGTKHLSSIDQLVSKIEQLVSKIEGKLPMQALSY